MATRLPAKTRPSQVACSGGQASDATTARQRRVWVEQADVDVLPHHLTEHIGYLRRIRGAERGSGRVQRRAFGNGAHHPLHHGESRWGNTEAIVPQAQE